MGKFAKAIKDLTEGVLEDKPKDDEDKDIKERGQFWYQIQML